MGKKPTKCKKDCSEHRFYLKPLHYWAYLSKEIKADFCHSSGTANKQKQTKKKSEFCFPKFCNDKKYYTPGFILPEDQNQIKQNDRVYFAEHLQKAHSNSNSKSQIFQAKPRAKCDYCAVCKVCFNDYIQHIKSYDHKRKIQQNKFNSHIQDLCNNFKRQQMVEQKHFSEETSFFPLQNSGQPIFRSSFNRIQSSECIQVQNLGCLKRVETQDTIFGYPQCKIQKRESFSPQKKCVVPILLHGQIYEKNQLNTNQYSPKKHSFFNPTESYDKIYKSFGFFKSVMGTGNQQNLNSLHREFVPIKVSNILITSGI